MTETPYFAKGNSHKKAQNSQRHFCAFSAFLPPFLLAGELARNHNRLGFHVIVERFRAVLFTQAALLQAAKRQLIENDLRRVDPCIAGFESFGSPRGLAEVARPYRRPEAIDGVVRLLECFIEIFHTHDRQSRTKYFLLNEIGRASCREREY